MVFVLYNSQQNYASSSQDLSKYKQQNFERLHRCYIVLNKSLSLSYSSVAYQVLLVKQVLTEPKLQSL